eukprot:4082527-Pyramimonas_sp.AAC.1
MVKYLSKNRKTIQKLPHCPFWSGRPTSSTPRPALIDAEELFSCQLALQRAGITLKLPATS